MDKLTELANALTATLLVHVGKPIWPNRRNSPRCDRPKATVHYRDGIALKLSPMQGDPDVLGPEEAKRYLAWLRAGNFGHPWFVENAFLEEL